MKGKDKQQQSPKMVEDDATEKLKKRARDLGLIVNAGAGKTTPAATQKKDAKK